jgi:hypothetical protein
MANLFKSYTKANVGTATSAVYTAPAATTSVIIGMCLANTTASPVTANVLVDKAGASDTVYLAKSLELPDGTLYEFNAGNKIILETGDILQVVSNTSSSIDVMVSVLEQT